MHSQEKYAQYAEKVHLFKGLSTHEVERILHCGKIIHFKEGQTVFHEGMLGTNMFSVLSGKIALHKKSRPLARCFVGDAFGEMAILNDRPRTATASALTDVKLFTLDEKELKRILDQNIGGKLLLNIVHVLSERLENANIRVGELRDQIQPAGAPR
ncbi:MAG: cyclic nucleotide-binding domain-containing protein [Candidatus Hydrogenedentes bacterium]|nr:cyclic nucleotide-binding domain-containing protein [Candidatus Hydrogenedentota bacterium]